MTSFFSRHVLHHILSLPFNSISGMIKVCVKTSSLDGLFFFSSFGGFFSEVVISTRSWSPLLQKCTVDLDWNLVIFKKTKQKMKAYSIPADQASSLSWGASLSACKLLLSDGSWRNQPLLCSCSAFFFPLLWPSHLFMQECSRQMQDDVWSIQIPVLSGNL